MLIWLVLSVFLISHPANTQKNDTKYVTPFFYKAEKEGRSFYLLGTMHLRVTLENFPNYVHFALQSSDPIVTETGEELMRAWDEVRMRYYSMWRFRGSRLSNQISKEDFIRITERLPNTSNLIIERLDYSWLCIFLYADETKPLDMQIQRLAKKMTKTVLGLEIPTYEMVQIYVEAVNCKNAQDVVQTLDSVMTSERIPHSYWNGDTEAKERDRIELCIDEPKACEKTKERDRRWIARMIDISKKYQRPFFAFGSLHFFGPDGILELLKKENYTITRILSEKDLIR